MTDQPQESSALKSLKSIPFFRDAVVALITGAAIVFGQQIAQGPQQLASEALYIEQLQIRLSELEQRVAEYAATNTSQQIELAALRASLNEELNFQDLLCSILEAQPGSNWAKVATSGEDGRPEFRMACLDAEYRTTFGLSSFQYLGQTDFEVWSEELADAFYSNDLHVLTTRSFMRTSGTWRNLRSNQLVQGRLTQFYFTYGDLEFIIGHFPGETTSN